MVEQKARAHPSEQETRPEPGFQHDLLDHDTEAGLPGVRNGLLIPKTGIGLNFQVIFDFHWNRG